MAAANNYNLPTTWDFSIDFSKLGPINFPKVIDSPLTDNLDFSNLQIEPEPQMALTPEQASQLALISELTQSQGIDLRSLPRIQSGTDKIPGIATDVTGIKNATDTIGRNVTSLQSGQGTLANLIGGPNYGGGTTGVYGQVANLGSNLATGLGIGSTIPPNQNLASYLSGQIGSGARDTSGAVSSAQAAIEQLLRDEAGTTRSDILGRLGTFDGGDLATRLNSGFSGITGTGTDTLTSLGQSLTGLGTDLTSSFNTLSAGQTGIQSALTGENGVGGIQGALTDLGTSLNEYQTGAQTQREDMLASLLGGQESISNTLGQQDVGGQLSQIATNMRRLQEGQQQDFASVAAMISSNVPAQTNTDVVQRAQFIQLMNNLRGFVGNPQSGLDPTTQATYAALTNAFDLNGRLIAQSQNPNTGSITARNITNDGQLVLRNFDSTGTAQTSQPLALNINALLNRAAATGAARQPAPTGLMAAQQPAGPSMTLQ